MKPRPINWPKNKTELQREQMEGIVDDRARAEITRPSRSVGDDNDKDVKWQRLGEPLDTIAQEGCRCRDKRAACLRVSSVKCVAETSDKKRRKYFGKSWGPYQTSAGHLRCERLGP